VIRIEKEALRTGVYDMINDRIRRRSPLLHRSCAFLRGLMVGRSLQLRDGRWRLGALGSRLVHYLPPCAYCLQFIPVVVLAIALVTIPL
jgi:hypothetical protein